MVSWELFAGILVFAFLIVIGIWIAKKLGLSRLETPERRAGRIGEQTVSQLIREILAQDEELKTNVKLSVDGRETELDHLIINSSGMFIIEVKNYTGQLAGGEKDYQWINMIMTPGGRFVTRRVKNPIRQVNRQVSILSRYLEQQGKTAPVYGYVFLMEHNSPVVSNQILYSREEIEKAIHGNAPAKKAEPKKQSI